MIVGLFEKLVVLETTGEETTFSICTRSFDR